MIQRITYILLFVLSSFWVSAETWMGAGIPTDPYQIVSVEQLLELADSVNNGNDYEGSYFILGADLDMANGTVECNDWIPIGSISAPFSGTFDGNGKVINHLTFAGGDYVGLFGYLSSLAVVKNMLFLEPSGWTNSCMGVICGLNEGKIQHCTVSEGTVTNAKIIGGIAGLNFGVIDSCSTNCYLYSRLATGGIAGYNYGEVRNCANYGGFDGVIGTGGIVGYNGGFKHATCSQDNHELGFVLHCINKGRVFGDTYTGGICGRNDGYVFNCGNDAFVKSLYEVGGIVGVNGSIVNAEGFVYNSYNKGTVYAESSTAGAICGTNTGHGTIDNVFNSGVIVSEKSVSTQMVAVDEGLAAHLYDFQVDKSDATYYETIDSVYLMLKNWADTVSLNHISPWVLADYNLGLGDYIASPSQILAEDVWITDNSLLGTAPGGVWLANDWAVYTVKGELVYLNRSGQRYFAHLKPGVYIVNKKKILVVNRD